MQLSLSVLLILLTSCALLQNQPSSSYRRSGGESQRRQKPVLPSVRKRVSILPFFNDAAEGGSRLSTTATEELERGLLENREFIVDPRATADFFVSSKEIYSGGGTELERLAKKAKLAGIALIFYGRVVNARSKETSDDIGLFRKSDSYAEVRVELRVFNVNAGREIFNKSFSSRVRNSAYRAYQGKKAQGPSYEQQLLLYTTQLAVRKSLADIDHFSQKLEWEGRIAKIIGSKIYLTAGRESGIKIGDVMKVITEGSEVYDPETGALIGISKGEIKGTLEVIDYFGPDGSISILHSGGSVVEGDYVQLYSHE